MKLRLHYWNCRGRAQTLRYIFADLSKRNSQIQYEETFESIETMMTTWFEHKQDEQISGPFRTLPVLHVDDREILGQTLSIAHFLGRKFQLYGDRTSNITDADLLESLINGVVSCAYTDVIENVFFCLWNKTDLTNPDGIDAYRVERARDSLQCLEELLSKSSTTFFYDQNEPTLADYFAFEAFDLAKTLHRCFLPENARALENLSNGMKDRPAPIQRLTAAPHEQEYLQMISKI